jgi:predicted nucleic acid-binding protein
MKVLDATFLIDYLDGIESTKEFYEANGAADEHWVMPVRAYAEALVGERNLPNGDVAGARAALSWGDT